ncbi:cytochrome P450 [Rhypophila decipiens]|uniref:Cytochrome P450 n=1 Tax=Rhypophila decipiens TaxID=261697 RepID=A0AAN6Y3S7_9PEZI|nr:cytochrome P450 [Rhypophila decipiens]
MATKNFYLFGEDISTAKEIQIPAEIIDQHGDAQTTDLEDELKQVVAHHFGVFESKGLSFSSVDQSLPTLSDVLSAEEPIAIAIDGHKVRQVPHPKGLPYVGNFFQVYPDHLGNHQRLFDLYGPMIQTTNLGRTVYQTNDPNLANIFFSESEYFSKIITEDHPLWPIKMPEAGIFLGDTNSKEWPVVHKFLAPALGPKAVRHYATTMQHTVEEAFKVFDELDERKESWNVYPYMLKLGSQAVGELVLGMDFKHFNSVDAPPHEMVALIAQSLALNKKISSRGSWYAHLPFGDPKRLQTMWSRIDELIGQSVNEAKSGGVEDLELQEAAVKAANMVDYAIRAVDNKGNKLPREYLVSALLVATGAGFTTTSSLLSWIIYGLVHYPGMQEKLLQELVDNDFDNKTQITADFTSKLTFQDKYIKEIQRRHNPAFQPARTAVRDVIVPGGYKLPKGAVVIPALHHIMNNPTLWDNPTSFDPERWDTPRVKERNKGTYTPFGSGARMCIGFNFALQEIKVFLPKLVYRYEFVKDDVDQTVEYDPEFQLIRPDNLFVRAQKRTSLPAKSATSGGK